MKILSALSGVATGLLGGAEKMAKRYTSGAPMARMTAVIAMMAYLPDGDADESEILTGVNAIVVKTGDVFNVKELVTKVNADVASLRASKRLGKAELMQRIRGAVDDDERRWLVTVAAAVGESDPLEARAARTEREDPFSAMERELAREIARELSVDPAPFGI